jgi:hypothetical protein
MASISGNAGVPNATITWAGPLNGSLTADDIGDYKITGLSSGTYTITPTKTGFTFTPVNQSIAVAPPGNVNNVDFQAVVGGSPPFSWKDCRNYNNFPNDTEDIQATLHYVVWLGDSRADGNPADCRAAGPPVDCRQAGNIPNNCRTPGTFGPGN